MNRRPLMPNSAETVAALSGLGMLASTGIAASPERAWCFQFQCKWKRGAAGGGTDLSRKRQAKITRLFCSCFQWGRKT